VFVPELEVLPDEVLELPDETLELFEAVLELEVLLVELVDPPTPALLLPPKPPAPTPALPLPPPKPPSPRLGATPPNAGEKLPPTPWPGKVLGR
jgi:hypothetical protein